MLQHDRDLPRSGSRRERRDDVESLVNDPAVTESHVGDRS